LERGIKYFRCLFSIELKKIYIFFNFINETLTPIMQKGSKIIHSQKKNLKLYSFKDFSAFTNFRLSSNLYLNSVHDKLYLLVKMNNKLNINFYLNCLKI